MFEIYLISSITCFVLMTICIKFIDGDVLVKDLFFNFIASMIPFINVIFVILMLFSLVYKYNVCDKKVF